MDLALDQCVPPLTTDPTVYSAESEAKRNEGPVCELRRDEQESARLVERITQENQHDSTGLRPGFSLLVHSRRGGIYTLGFPSLGPPTST